MDPNPRAGIGTRHRVSDWD